MEKSRALHLLADMTLDKTLCTTLLRYLLLRNCTYPNSFRTERLFLDFEATIFSDFSFYFPTLRPRSEIFTLQRSICFIKPISIYDTKH